MFDNIKYLLSYENTIAFLTNVNETSRGKIPCMPKIKVIEDKLIVGILTETNQFIPIQPPTQDIYGKDLPAIEDINYEEVDKMVMSSSTIDTERVRFIKNIELESNFYTMFRNTVRILLGKHKYIHIREDIEKLSGHRKPNNIEVN